MTYDESRGRPSVDRALVRRVFAYARPYWPQLALMLAAIVASAIVELVPPLIIRQLIDVVLPEGDVRQLNLLALAMLAVPVVTGLIGVVQRYLSAQVGEGIIHDLRRQMYAHLQSMDLAFFTHTKAGEIVSRFSADVVGAQNAITGTLPNIVTNAVTLVSTLVVMLKIDWRLTLLSIVVVPLFLLPARRVGAMLRDIRRRSLALNADMSSIIQETLSINGAVLVKTFGTQAAELDRFVGVVRQVRDNGVRQALVGRWFMLGLGMSAAIGTALVYWAGGYLVILSERPGSVAATGISIGTLVAFAAYLRRLYGPITSLTNVQVEFTTSMVSFERVFEYLDLEPRIRDREDATALQSVDGRIRFEDVSFSYRVDETGGEGVPSAVDRGGSGMERAGGRPAEGAGSRRRRLVNAGAGGAAGDGSNGGAPAPMGEAQDIDSHDTVPDVPDEVATRRWALHDISFDADPGELVALVGPSGAGKTTLAYLLLRLYDPTTGRISLDGHDLRSVTGESLAAQYGVVMQETYLFHDTILANLRYARPDAMLDQVVEAAKAAHIHDVILAMPDGYDTVVGERGYRLSGGEKQRLAIARVILKDPSILILDEATSHLDSQSEAHIQAALDPLFEGRTSIVIAHRLSTILNADKILVLEGGRLVEQGTHDDLLRQGGLYAELYEKQFGEEADAEADAVAQA